MRTPRKNAPPWRRAEATERLPQPKRLALEILLQRLRIIGGYLGISARIQLLSKLERIAGNPEALNGPTQLAAALAALESLEAKLLAHGGSSPQPEGSWRGAAKLRKRRRREREPGPSLLRTAPTVATDGGERWLP
jgi:hypothetical protein